MQHRTVWVTVLLWTCFSAAAARAECLGSCAQALEGALLAMLGYGAAIELLQLRVPGRDGSLLDLGADLIGILLALGISRGGWVSLR